MFGFVSHYPLLGEHPGNSTHELLLKFMLLKEMSKSSDAPLVWDFINISPTKTKASYRLTVIQGVFHSVILEIILNSAVKEDENGADAQKHEGF